MAWMQKLCEVYDHAIGTTATQGANPLVPVGLAEKSIKYHVMLSADGELLGVVEIPGEDQKCRIPSTMSSMTRRGEKTSPYPLAEQIQYICCRSEADSEAFSIYLAQLQKWSDYPNAPRVLKTLISYLSKRTLLRDLETCALNIKLHANQQQRDLAGKDKNEFVCFSVNDDSPEKRLWMRPDVLQSWIEFYSAQEGSAEDGICYVTGQRARIASRHLDVGTGTLKLISGKEGPFRFLYKGRFVEDKSAVTVSELASLKSHLALNWLLQKQGLCFSKFGMLAVAWNVDSGQLEVPGVDYGEEEEDAGNTEISNPNTFEGYVRAFRKAHLGDGTEWEAWLRNTPEATKNRINNICILCMEDALGKGKGRMSITYYQELPGNDYVQRLKNWRDTCKWPRPRKGQPDKAPTIRQIGDAVLGPDQVRTAWGDFQCDKAATKIMRELSLRIIMCIVESAALPQPYVRQAFHKSIAPLAFTDSKGRWQKQQWLECMATTCALIRKMKIDQGTPVQQVRPVLDPMLTDRSYLYGRLLAVADVLEQRAVNDNQPTNALRMMTQFVQRPFETWGKLHDKLLPYIMHLGDEQYQRRIGEIEALFREEERSEQSALSEMFLIGYQVQRQAMWQPPERLDAAMDYVPSRHRDELFGCLLAVADVAEQKADAERDGMTNAVAMAAAFAHRPGDTWAVVHDKLLPYLERLGQRQSQYYRAKIRQTERCFDELERISPAPLSALYLHGYYCMRTALLYGKVGMLPVQCEQQRTISREALYGALFAEEDRAERIVLDCIQHVDEDENRPSNTLRFLSRASGRPENVWQHLYQRMRPYAQKMRFGHVMERVDALHASLQEHGWDTDAPLNSSYLHYFYTAQHEEE